MTEWLSEYDEERLTKSERVVPYRVHLFCPYCKTGEMKPNGYTWPTFNVGYHHECDNCHETLAVDGKKYPRIEYRSEE